MKDNSPMATLTISAKGQIALTEEMLQHLGVIPGQKVVVEKLPGGRLAIRAAAKSARRSQPQDRFRP
jgi:bifunctional DNA-binding transcriptional regulator/antitoxin component of YhaV-PrlF toxin-antitoxin module